MLAPAPAAALRRALLVDGVPALLLLLTGELELVVQDGMGWPGRAPLWMTGAVVALSAAVLVARRRAPIAVLAATAALLVAPRALLDTEILFWGALAPMCVALYSAARHSRPPVDVAALLLPAGAIAALALVIPGVATLGSLAFTVPVLLISWVLGATARRIAERGELELRRLEAEAVSERLRAEAAAHEERTRLARELHDIVAHGVTVMVLQAGSARLQLPEGTDRSAEALQSVERTGRDALVELRRMVGLLRTDADPDGALAPQPGLADLDDLLRQTRAAGLPVELVVEGEPRSLSAGLDLSLHRIVQESLTNALKHNGPVPTRVRLRYEPETVTGRRDRDAALLVRRLRMRPRQEDAQEGRGGERSGEREALARAAGWPRSRRDARAGRSLLRGPRGGAWRERRVAGHRSAPGDVRVIRVIIADDQSLVRGGIRAILSAAPDIEVVSEAADGVEAVERCRSLSPDLVLTDIRMPRLDGLAATKAVLVGGTTKVLVLTTFDADEVVYEALAAGASGFLLKDGPAEGIADAVRVVHAGQSILAPAITKRVIAEHARRPLPPPLALALDALSSREREVLLVLAEGLSNQELARRLHLSETTVKTHVASILTKLRLRDRLQAVVFAYEHGLVTPGDRRPS